MGAETAVNSNRETGRNVNKILVFWKRGCIIETRKSELCVANTMIFYDN